MTEDNHGRSQSYHQPHAAPEVFLCITKAMKHESEMDGVVIGVGC